VTALTWAVAALAVLAAGIAVWAFRRLGRWLVIGDALEQADCILVLGGHVPLRPMEAAALHAAGWAPEIWLTQYPRNADEATLARFGVDITPEFVISRRVLERLGVPADAIVLVEEPSSDTHEELRIVQRRLHRRRPGGRIILVTSGFHARRVRAIWRGLGAPEPAVVRAVQSESFVPDRWFTNTGDAKQVAHEFFGLLNAWAGHPLKRRL